MLNNQDFAQSRAKSLGGSDIGAILGLSRFKTPIDLWLEKTGQAAPQKISLPLRFGQFAESFIASEFMRETQLELVEDPSPIIHPKYPFLTGHIDRFVLQDNKPLRDETGKLQPYAILECKTANPFSQHEWGETNTDEIPLTYLVQCLWYLMLTNCDTAFLAVLFGNADFRTYTIKRDLELEAKLIDKAVHFWNTYVIPKVAPPPINEADCRNLFANSTPSKQIEADAVHIKTIEQLKNLQTELAHTQEEIDKLKQDLMLYMKDAELLTHQGQALATWKSPKPSLKLDTKRLSLEEPELVSKYQMEVTNSRRFLIKEIR